MWTYSQPIVPRRRRRRHATGTGSGRGCRSSPTRLPAPPSIRPSFLNVNVDELARSGAESGVRSSRPSPWPAVHCHAMQDAALMGSTAPAFLGATPRPPAACCDRSADVAESLRRAVASCDWRRTPVRGVVMQSRPPPRCDSGLPICGRAAHMMRACAPGRRERLPVDDDLQYESTSAAPAECRVTVRLYWFFSLDRLPAEALGARASRGPWINQPAQELQLICCCLSG